MYSYVPVDHAAYRVYLVMQVVLYELNLHHYRVLTAVLTDFSFAGNAKSSLCIYIAG